MALTNTPVLAGTLNAVKPPSLEHQKRFIADASDSLQLRVKETIFRLVMREVGKSYEITEKDGQKKNVPVVVDGGGAKTVSILLDNILDGAVVTHIYNIIKNYMATMNEPAHGNKS